MTWQGGQFYNSLPVLPQNQDGIETGAVLKACISERAAVAELKKEVNYG